MSYSNIKVSIIDRVLLLIGTLSLYHQFGYQRSIRFDIIVYIIVSDNLTLF